MTILISTDEQELELVGWHHTLPIFYNQRLTEFNLKDKHDRLMSEKANELGITLLDLKTRMNACGPDMGGWQDRTSQMNA